MSLEQQKQIFHKNLEKNALNVTRWIGSTQSLVVHTGLFFIFFILIIFGVKFDTIMLLLTTVVSLEAIYLSIFIQMSVNRQAQKLEDVSEDIEEIQKDVDEIQVDIDEIQEDVEGIEEDIEEIQEDVEGIEEDIEEIQEDVEEIHDENGDQTEKPKKVRTAKEKAAADAVLVEMLKNLEKKVLELKEEIRESKKESPTQKAVKESIKEKVTRLLKK